MTLPPLREGRLTVAVGEVALVLAGGQGAAEGIAVLLDCAAGRRRPQAGDVAWALAPPPGAVVQARALRCAVRERAIERSAGPLVVVDGRRDPGAALAAVLAAASAGRAVLAGARVGDLAPALARAMLGAAALLRLRGAGSDGEGWSPSVALWTLADGRLRLHARVARAGPGGSVARLSGPS